MPCPYFSSSTTIGCERLRSPGNSQPNPTKSFRAFGPRETAEGLQETIRRIILDAALLKGSLNILSRCVSASGATSQIRWGSASHASKCQNSGPYLIALANQVRREQLTPGYDLLWEVGLLLQGLLNSSETTPHPVATPALGRCFAIAQEVWGTGLNASADAIALNLLLCK